MNPIVLYNGSTSFKSGRTFGYARQEVIFNGLASDVAFVLPFDAKYGIGGIAIQNLTNVPQGIDLTLENLDNQVNTDAELVNRPIWTQFNAGIAALARDTLMPPVTGFRVRPIVTSHATTALTWAAGEVTVTAAAHGLQTGDIVTIAGVTPVGYNGEFQITRVDANTFKYALAADPGLVTVQGTVAVHVIGKVIFLGT